MIFELNKKQIKKLDKWKKTIKRKYGRYGHFTYKFTPTGIGDAVSVYSELLNKELDLTDIENW